MQRSSVPGRAAPSTCRSAAGLVRVALGVGVAELACRAARAVASPAWSSRSAREVVANLAAAGSWTRMPILSASAAACAALMLFLALALARREAVRRRRAEESLSGLLRAADEGLSRQRELEVRLDYLERYDPLTGLPNRRHLIEKLEQQVLRVRKGGESLSLLLLDVDRFKHVNDLFGSETGDRVLRHVAGELRAAAGERDLVARIGSDEFAVVHLDGAEEVGASAVAERIRRAVSRSAPVAERDFAVTVTTGMALFPHNGDDARTLLRNADLALGKAKSHGRNSIHVFDDSLGLGIPEFLSLERRLFAALENGEYLLHYQPYFHLATGEVAGAEALIKWNNCDLGVVPPSRFIRSLEETGMIVDVGRWVLETACGRIREWGFPISVNLSLIQFRHDYLVGMVADALGESRIDPRYLTLEVTESVFLHDMEFAIRTLKQLKDLGVSVSVDDFGTGYSSLSYLKRLPVDGIKIDMSFVRDVARDQDAASIVSAITTLARGLKLATVAEGVETEEQRNVLHLLRCDMGQGFYFSRAIPPVDFQRFLERGRASHAAS